MTDDRAAADLARSIDDARQRLITFVEGCPDQDWSAAPVEGDARSVGVIADHVAHAYGYLAGFIGELVAGEPVEVTPDIIDDLNAAHATESGEVTKASVAEHLRSSGDPLIELVAGLDANQVGDGRVRRFAIIAARHADDHRAEIETALAASAR